LEPPLCVVSSWVIRVYSILVWNTISGSSNLDTCFYHCLIITLIFHLKILINFFFFFIIIIIIIIIITIIVVIVVVVLLLSIIYTINLHVVRPRSCRVIYYFDTLTLRRRHQSFGRVKYQQPLTYRYCTESCKTITTFFHPHRRAYRQKGTLRYFTESCKKIIVPATFTDRYTDTFTDRWRTFQLAWLSDCLVGRHIYRRISRWPRHIQCVCALTRSYRRICRRTSKNLEGFSKF